MRNIVLGALALLMIASGAAMPQSRGKDALRRDIDYARSKVYPALVNITVVMRYYTGGRAQRTPGGGSGVIVTPQGHVLTNYHVAGNTTRISCTLTTGESVDATVVAHDPLTDLSVLKIRRERRENPQAALPYARLADSSLLKVGDPVLAMGNPLMLSSSLTLGVVSNTTRVFTDFTGTEMEERELEQDEKTGMFTRWIQHDAMILPGNSGGPLVNLKGEIVGINELGGTGVGFAIPSSTAASVLRQVLAHGQVRRGWIGIAVLPVSKIGRKTGALVSAVTPDSPAAKAGLAAGDILLSMSGSPVSARFFEEVPLLYQRIADLPIGATIALRALHNGQAHTTMLTVARMKPFTGDEEELRKLGVTVRGITDAMALSRRLVSKDGVLVTGLRPGYPLDAAIPQVQEGDIITAIAGRSTPNLSAFRKVVASLGKTDVPVAFRRVDQSLVTMAKPPPDSGEEGGELPKAWLGVKTQVVTPEIGKAIGAPDAKGFRITQVYQGTEAAKAGLRTGDIITAVNGTELEASRPQDAEDLRRIVEDNTVGESTEMTVLRGKIPVKIKVVMEATPVAAAQAKKSKNDDLEFAVREITPLDRMERRLPANLTGVLVVDVTTGGWAHMAGLHIDDIIQAIHGAQVKDVASFDRAMSAGMKKRPHVVDIFVQRGYRTHFVFIEPDWSKIAGTK